jgi:glutamine synthetase
MNTLASLQERLAAEAITFVDLLVVDLTGRWRHVTIPAERFDEALMSEGIAFDASNLGYAPVEGSDMVLLPDLGTAYVGSHDEERILSVICNIHHASRERMSSDPRAVAQRAEAHLRSQGIAEAIRMSPEFEFYVFSQAEFCVDSCSCGYTLVPLNPHAERSYYHACPPDDQLFALRNAVCRRLGTRGIPVKYHHHEVGALGQLEIELGFLGLVEAADTTLIIKNTVRQEARARSLTATFLPKPIYGENGSGLHVHQFLEQDDHSVFDQDDGLSELALCYLGGLLRHGRSLCALTNPSTNSYRRLVPGYEAPVWFAYGEGNRSAAVRVPGYATAAERRVELRTPDATCNPYLAFAAMLMAGLDGIRRGLNAAEMGFGPYNGNLYDASDEDRARLAAAPDDLDSALRALVEDHEYLLAGDVFTVDQIEHWVRSKQEEARRVRHRPHPYEYPLYFDL